MVCDPEPLDTESVLRAAHTSSEGRSTRGGPWRPKIRLDLLIITACSHAFVTFSRSVHHVPCQPAFRSKSGFDSLPHWYSVHTQHILSTLLLGDTSIIAVLELRVTHRCTPRQSASLITALRVSPRQSSRHSASVLASARAAPRQLASLRADFPVPLIPV